MSMYDTDDNAPMWFPCIGHKLWHLHIIFFSRWLIIKEKTVFQYIHRPDEEVCFLVSHSKPINWNLQPPCCIILLIAKIDEACHGDTILKW